MVNIIENSSYVLISIILSAKFRTDERASPDHPVNKRSRSNLPRLRSTLMPTLQPRGLPPANRLDALTLLVDFNTFLCLHKSFAFTKNYSRIKSLTFYNLRFKQNTKQLNRRSYFITSPTIYRTAQFNQNCYPVCFVT